jgi:predicted dehydrogenase
MDRRVKIGIVGIGGYGRHLLELLLAERDAANAELVAAVVVDPAADHEPLEFLRTHFPSAKVYYSWNEWISTGHKLDLMVLPVGIPSHKNLCLAALGAGCNVLLEKPLAGSVEEAMAIIEAAESSGRFVAIGYQDMYGGSAPAIKQIMLDGGIGRIRRIKAFAIWGRPAEYYQRNSWAGRLTLHEMPVHDSPFNNALAHYLNMALFLAGRDLENPALPLAAEAALFRGHRIESCDTAVVHWQTDTGIRVEICFSHLTRANTPPEMEIEGTSGIIAYMGEDFWEIRPHDGFTVRHHLETTTENRRTMLKRVILKVRGADETIFTPRQALAQVRAVTLAHASAGIQTLSAELLCKHATVDDGGRRQHWIDLPEMERILRGAYNGSRIPTLRDFGASPSCGTSQPAACGHALSS